MNIYDYSNQIINNFPIVIKIVIKNHRLMSLYLFSREILIDGERERERESLREKNKIL
jgi:hypothetical protein